MRISLVAIAAAATLAMLEQAPAIAQQQSYERQFGPLLKSADCDDACLRRLMDQYLSALTAHDPSRLPLGRDVRFTENTNEMAVGDGLWQTISGILPHRIVITDPTTAQVAYYGAVLENGRTSLLYVRLKTQTGKITEIESAVVREVVGNFGSYTDLQGPLSDWNEVLAPSQRRSRQELIALVNQYFEGIEQSNGDIVPFDPSCVRWENNRNTSRMGNPSKGAAPAPNTTASILQGMTIAQTFNTHVFSYITHIGDRRFPIVDEQRGIVLAIVTFTHPGNVRTVEVPGHGKVELTGVTSAFPNTTEILESFRVKDGKIVGIYAYVNLLPYHQKTGW
ncbi:MAG TPA: hypothetical protein VMF03_22280 [Steroidobacteraceae bacterium]|nr:hypothetical protein [Steroidobacteraceae bacterium]